MRSKGEASYTNNKYFNHNNCNIRDESKYINTPTGAQHEYCWTAAERHSNIVHVHLYIWRFIHPQPNDQDYSMCISSWIRTTNQQSTTYHSRTPNNTRQNLSSLTLVDGFVITSAMLLSDGTCVNVINPEETFSRMKWYRISICFDRFSVVYFEARSIVPWLSTKMLTAFWFR